MFDLHILFNAGSAERVLDHFRDRFIAEMDANAIVMELRYRGLISNGDQRTITQESDPSRQNQILHARLMMKCTVRALQDVCDIITAVKGNPRMRSMGQDMKTELEKGLCYVGFYTVHAFVFECVKVCTYVCMYVCIQCECMLSILKWPFIQKLLF